MIQPKATIALSTILFCCLSAANARAGTVLVTVTDERGQPVADAVAVARPQSGRATLPRANRVIDQIDKEFLPYVSVMPVGTEISFPNKDNVRHHVYSVSPAKKFELPLYAGTPSHPVRFDKPGVVTLGCNIHDWMIAHVYVSDSPYYGQSGANGQVKLDDLPPGEYTVTIWHPRATLPEIATAQRVSLGNAASTPIAFSMRLKKEFRPRRAPTGGKGSYR